MDTASDSAWEHALKIMRTMASRGICGGTLYAPPSVRTACLVCETTVMSNSSDGVTCGAWRCRDALSEKVAELEELASAKIRELEEENEELRKALNNDEPPELKIAATKACEILKNMLPSGSDADHSPLKSIWNIMRDLEEALKD